MARQINCGICAFNGNTVAMELKKDTYFECPECTARTYDNDDGNDAFIRNYKKHQQNNYISRSFQPGTHVVGGGDPVGKPKNESMKKKTISRLNFEACEKRYY